MAAAAGAAAAAAALLARFTVQSVPACVALSASRRSSPPSSWPPYSRRCF